MSYEADFPWWKRPDHEIPEAVFSEVRRIRREQSYRRENLLRHYRLYSHRMLQGLDAATYARDLDLPDSRLRLNVIQPVVDTAHTLIATNRPRVQFTTNGADYSAMRRAEKMSAFVDGQFDQVGLVDLTPGICKDAEIAGYGAIKIDDEGDDIRAIRVLPEELEWDDVEAKHGNPRSLFHVVEKSIDWMMETSGNRDREQIKQSGMLTDGFSPSFHGDLLTVVEAWHLPSSPGAKDGRRVICTDRAVLRNDPWEPSEFPVLIWRWNELSRGYAGQGIPEQLRGIQLEINRLLYKIQRHMKAASSKLMLHKGSEVDPNTTNAEFEKVYWTGEKPPVFATIQAIAPQYFEQLDRLYARAFEVTGVTQLQAQGVKPAGLDSGKALRAYNDLQTKRFLAIGQSWEQFHVQIAKRLVQAARRLASRPDGGGYKVQAELGGRLIDIDWSDVAMQEHDFKITVWPVGIMPSQPAGQYQAAVEISNDFEQMAPYALSLLSGDPDLKRVIKRIQAPQNLAEKIIETILEEDRIMDPEPYWVSYIGHLISQVQLAYAEAQVGDVEEGKLELFRGWLDRAVAMQQRAAMAAAPPVPPPGPAVGPDGEPAPAPGLPAGINQSSAAMALPAQVTQPIP